VDDSVVVELAKRCDRIRVLGLAYCEAVSDIGVDALAERAADLEWLNVRGCPKVSVPCRARFAAARPACTLLYDKG
jgi:hypothetical protein